MDQPKPAADRTARAFDLSDATAILTRTPATLDALLRGLPPGWSDANEGGETWSPFDVVGHLIHADRTNWIPRAKIILAHGDARAFDDFDRFAQIDASKDRSLIQLLDEFVAVRQASLVELDAIRFPDLERRGRHSGLGSVTLRQLLAAWVVHDLDHLFQITRVLAAQYTTEVGPWRRYLRIVRDT